MMKLETALNSRHNSLNALRLILATLVIVSHAPLTGGFGQPLKFGDLEIGGWAVGGFFTISGWLITASRLRMDLGAFLWRRALRIYPGFWAALLAVAFIFAPIAVAVGGGHYRVSEAMAYVVRNVTLTITQSGIGDSLSSSPYQGSWNLSLWTLRWEFLCYLGVGLLMSFGWVRRSRWTLVVAWILVSVPYAVTVATGGPLSTAIAQGSRLGGYFLAGAVAYLYRDKIPVKGWLALIAGFMVAGLAMLGLGGALGAAPVAYLCLWLGHALPLQWLGRRNDISYGVYIYAFPTQLLFTIFGFAKGGLLLYTGVCIVAVLPMAWASWLVVEQPLLRLKGLVRARKQAPRRVPSSSVPQEL